MSRNGAPDQAASFSDDTSLPRVDYHVSIQAQVLREHPYNWYFFLKSKAPQGQREFKIEAIETFFAISEADRQSIFKTLKRVRIHIVDPRPYTTAVEEALASTLPKGGFRPRVSSASRSLSLGLERPPRSDR